jgi:hypothetical protein
MLLLWAAAKWFDQRLILEKELIIWAEIGGWAADLRLIFVDELEELWPHLLRDKVARGEVCSFILQYNKLIYIRFISEISLVYRKRDFANGQKFNGLENLDI